jgi:hypothetical protein
VKFACRICGVIYRCPNDPTGAEWRLLDARMGWHAVHEHNWPQEQQT